DLEHSTVFYRDVMGLQHVGPTDGPVRFLRCSDKPHDLALFQGEPGLKRIAFELESEADLPTLRSALRVQGVEHAEIPAEDVAQMHSGPGLRMIEPNT